MSVVTVPERRERSSRDRPDSPRRRLRGAISRTRRRLQGRHNAAQVEPAVISHGAMFRNGASRRGRRRRRASARRSRNRLSVSAHAQHKALGGLAGELDVGTDTLTFASSDAVPRRRHRIFPHHRRSLSRAVMHMLSDPAAPAADHLRRLPCRRHPRRHGGRRRGLPGDAQAGAEALGRFRRWHRHPPLERATPSATRRKRSSAARSRRW